VENHDVPRRGRAPSELAEDRGERLARIASPGRLRRDVARPAERIVHLLEAELADVAGRGRLGHAAAFGGERVDQLELRPDPLSRHEAQHEPLAFCLAEPARLLHRPSIKIQVCHDGRPATLWTACCES
jgi:hypothetical protein